METIDSYTMTGSLLAGSGVAIGTAGINVVTNNISISGFDSITVNSLVAAGGNVSLVANAGTSSFINLAANVNASGNLQFQSGTSGAILFSGTPRSIAGANITFTGGHHD